MAHQRNDIERSLDLRINQLQQVTSLTSKKIGLTVLLERNKQPIWHVRLIHGSGEGSE